MCQTLYEAKKSCVNMCQIVSTTIGYIVFVLIQWCGITRVGNNVVTLESAILEAGRVANTTPGTLGRWLPDAVCQVLTLPDVA